MCARARGHPDEHPGTCGHQASAPRARRHGQRRRRRGGVSAAGALEGRGSDRDRLAAWAARQRLTISSLSTSRTKIVGDLNRRILEWRRFSEGPPVFVRLVSKEEMLDHWRSAQAAKRARPPARPAADPAPETPRGRRGWRWWRRGRVR